MKHFSVNVYIDHKKMAASRGRVPRFACDSVGDSSMTEQRPQRRSARNVIQSEDAGVKKLLRSKSTRSGKDTKVSTGIDGGFGEVGDDGLGERVDVGIHEGVDGEIGERVEGEMEGMVVDETVRCLCSHRVEEGEMVCCDVSEMVPPLVHRHEGRCGGDGGKRVCVLLLSVDMFVGTTKRSGGVEKRVALDQSGDEGVERREWETERSE